MVQPAARTEWIDCLFTRPVARVCVALCAPLALPPWVWVLMLLLHGAAAAVFLALGWGLWCAAALAGYLPWGAASLELSARAGQAPGRRHRLHGWVQCVGWAALHVGLYLALLAAGEGPLGSLALTLGAALSLAVCTLALVGVHLPWRSTCGAPGGGDRAPSSALWIQIHGGLLMGPPLPSGRADGVGMSPDPASGGEVPHRCVPNRGERLLALSRVQQAAEGGPPLAGPAALASTRALSLLRLLGPSSHAALLAVLAAVDRPALYAWLTLTVLNALALLAIWLKRHPRALGAG